MKIVVGITGGIAAYKAVGVVRAFVLAGHDVQVVATDAALRFIGKPTLEAISRNPVHTDLYEGVAEVRHVAIGQAADLIVVAPATANFLAQLAGGFAPDLLGNTILASRAPLVVAPAMHTEMWQNPATQANISTLRSRAITIVGPEVGQLTGVDTGPGRMSEPEDIVAAALAVLAKTRDLVGRSILVTAGGTREPLDPVRFIGNRSSGKQGVALARAAAARGADVTLIGANLEIDAPANLNVVHVGTTAELADAVREASARADVIVMAAAVADYRPERIAESKIKKENQGETLTLNLVRNPDILKDVSSGKRPDQIVVGFAAETETDPAALLKLAREKIERKGCDFLVVNSVGWTTGFATDGNTVTILNSEGDIVGEASGTKSSVADRILDAIA